MSRDLRARLDTLEAALARRGDAPPDGAARRLVKVLPAPEGTTFPAGMPAYFSCAVGTIEPGTPAEGGVATVTWDAAPLWVYVVGSKAPAIDDMLPARHIDYRWVAERMQDVPTTHPTFPGCPCADIPTTLHMTSSKPNSNLGMFQNATLVYGPTDPAYDALGLGANSYISVEDFPDSTTGDRFNYFFTCYNGYYILTRVYATSSYGSPYLDIIRYRWLIGLAGNHCGSDGPPPVAFLLSNGQVYQGGDRTARVTIGP